MAKLHTPLFDRLGIRLPIVQAPMPGTSTPALVAAVSQAGALGSFGSAYSQPEAMQRDAEAGGHRGSYLRNPYDSMTGTFAPVRMIVRNVKTPVVAAGGIMDGAGVAAALSREKVSGTFSPTGKGS